jgi:hypothetical protein
MMKAKSSALILIAKASNSTTAKDVVAYLKRMTRRLNREHEAGIPHLLKDLSAHHSALMFANEVNRDFGKLSF